MDVWHPLQFSGGVKCLEFCACHILNAQFMGDVVVIALAIIIIKVGKYMSQSALVRSYCQDPGRERRVNF